MLKVGLTGGIGCGKSTVCNLFAQHGIPIIDADIIARQLVEPGQPALCVLAEKFGTDILNLDGSLDRAKLRTMVFADAEKKRQLDDLMHPLVYDRINSEMNVLSGDYCIVAVPLLLETGKAEMFDKILVIDCSVETQIQRVSCRDGLDREQILRIIATQISRDERLKMAHEVIDNSTTLTQLAKQVEKLHNSLIFLATVRTSSA